MPPKSTKKQPVKIKYTKKKDKWSLVPPEPKQPAKDMETAELAQIISIFGNWTNEQKQRNLKYLCARYYDFL
jgi:hypothetical protein